jgi:hypothetical protein
LSNRARELLFNTFKEFFMQFMLMFYDTAEILANAKTAAAPDYWGSWMAYAGAVHQAGVVVSGNGLEAPRTATTIRLRGDKRQVQDGPFADTKEQLGGYFVIDVPNLDAALEWAVRAPCASTGGVEVRPIMPPPQAAR